MSALVPAADAAIARIDRAAAAEVYAKRQRVNDELSAFERHLRNVRAIGVQRPPEPDHAAYERFMGEFHRAFPDATVDEYVRAKHAAAAAAGVLVGYGEQ